MDDDQQFCLRWNNHQSTLISVFDTLLENGTLVDCTLAAEGQFLKAHKVVLSACSPYFASLLSQQYDKHPIFILKDVKFQELRAMMDYMYRGEVNISQDQLAALLKAAESLQIKGLSDSRGGGGGGNGSNATNAGSSGGQKIIDHKQPQLSVPVSVAGKSSGGISSGYTLEQKRPRHAMGPLSIDTQELAGSREGSSSPTSRKRKKIRRRSLDNIMADNHELSNSSSHSMQINSSTAPSNTSAAAATTAATSSSSSTSTTSAAAAALLVSAAATGLNVTKKTDNSKMESGVEQDMDNDDETDHHDQHQENNKNIVQMKKEQNHKRKSQVVDTENKDNSDMLIEPKSEYDDGNDETVEDLTLDEEELLDDLEQAGPSHGGEGSSQGYAQWQVDRSQDEVFLAAQEAAGQQRDPQAMILECLDELDDQVMYEIITEDSDEEIQEKQCSSPKNRVVYATVEEIDEAEEVPDHIVIAHIEDSGKDEEDDMRTETVIIEQEDSGKDPEDDMRTETVIIEQEDSGKDAEDDMRTETVIIEQEDSGKDAEDDMRTETVIIEQEEVVEENTNTGPREKRKYKPTKKAENFQKVENVKSTEVNTVKADPFDVEKCKKMAELLAVVNILSNNKAFKKKK